MVLRIVGLLTLLTAVFAGIMALMVVLGSFGISDNYALQTAGCAQPCWHGVQPGVTRVAEAFASLDADPLVADLIRNDPSSIYPCELEWKMLAIPLFTGCMVIRPDNPVDGIILRYADAQIRLADVMAVFGRPRLVEFCQRYDFGLRFRESAFVTLYFQKNIMVMAYHPTPQTWRLDPRMIVKMVRYEKPQSVLAIGADAAPWRGFVGAAEVGQRCSY
jgi:hypothetical protein